MLLLVSKFLLSQELSGIGDCRFKRWPGPYGTTLLITDPQNDFLSPEGVTWGVVGNSVTENHNVENIDSLFKAAKANDMPVFISPRYYSPTDHGWQFEGALEALMHNIGMFDRDGALTTEGFDGSGADWLE